MVRPVTNPNVVEYNGFTFPGPFNAKVRCVPEYDTSRRTVKYHNYHVTIEAYIVDDDNCSWEGGAVGAELDDRMPEVRSLLIEPGKRLTLTNQGLGGDLDVDSSNCIGFGPLPQILVWEPAGANRCAHIVWEVVFSISERGKAQSASVKEPKGPYGEFVYAVTYSFTPEGATIRTITGRMEVFVRRDGKDGVNLTADSYRGFVRFPTIENFRRTQTYSLSEDRRFLSFSITDTEIPSNNPYMPYCVNVDVRQSVRALSTHSVVNAPQWRVSIRGTITVGVGVPLERAWVAFWSVVASRRAAMSKYIKQYGGFSNDDKKEIQVSIITDALDFDEDLFGRSMSFSVSWRLIGVKINDVLERSATFKPVPGSWSLWRQSMDQRIDHPFGHAGRSYAKDMADVLVDFRHTGPPVKAARIGAIPIAPGRFAKALLSDDSATGAWIDYVNEIGTEYRPASVVTSPTGNANAADQPNIDLTPEGGDVNWAEGSPKTAMKTVQARGAGELLVIIEGYGIRVDKHITAPRVTVMGGKAAMIAPEYADKVSGVTSIGKTVDGKTKFKRTWSRAYIIPDAAQGTWRVEGVPKQFQDDVAEKR